MDYIWSRAYQGEKGSFKESNKEPKLARMISSERFQIDDIENSSYPTSEYSFMNCLAYILYPPLYIAGPIISFNAYYHYSKFRQQSESI